MDQLSLLRRRGGSSQTSVGCRRQERKRARGRETKGGKLAGWLSESVRRSSNGWRRQKAHSPECVLCRKRITGTRMGREDSETRRGCPRVVAGVNWLPMLTGWKGERARKRERETGRQASTGIDGMQREKWPAYLEPELGLLGVRPSGASPVNCRSLVDALLEWA